MRDGKKIAAHGLDPAGKKERVLHRLLNGGSDRFPGSFSGAGCVP
jgi:hypothetical protein